MSKDCRTEKWRTLIARTAKREFPRLTVFVDGHCRFCRRTGQWIRRLDWLGLFQVLSYRDGASYVRYGLNMEAVDREIHVVKRQGGRVTVYRGFDAVMAIIRHVPLLWPLLPVVGLLRGLGLGPRLYRWLADHRVFIAGAQACREGLCASPKGGR
ncbi:MAG: DUF393 domain-containing protein [Alicyclobacillaceae bacterium]|nr:DUF393 domain-containing protein [Alicyclobacillaceae bacterium]